MSRKVEELKQMDVSDIRQKVENLEKELYSVKCQSQTSRVEKPHRFKELKKEIARCKTILKEKEKSNAAR